MATSSLYKTFYLTGKNETRGFVALLDSAVSSSSSSHKIIKTKTLPSAEWEKLVNATKRQKK